MMKMNQKQRREKSNINLKPLCLIILCFLMLNFIGISFISAMDFDNVKSVKDTYGDAGYRDLEIKNVFGLGKTLWSGSLDSNTETCMNNCEAIQTIILHEKGSLIDDIIFRTLQGDGSWVEQAIRSYEIYIKIGEEEFDVDDFEYQCKERESYSKLNKSYFIEKYDCGSVNIGSHKEKEIFWGIYNLGDELDAGTYQIKLEGEKKSSRTIDWIYKTQGETLNEWAIWGEANGNIAYWDFDEGTGENSTDLINQSNMTMTNFNWVTSGISGSAVEFNGSIGSGTSFNNLNLDGAKNRSFNFWASVNGTGANTFLSMGTTSTNQVFALDTEVYFIEGNGGANNWFGDVNATKLHMLTVTYNGTTASYYINGTLVDTFVHVYNTLNTPLFLGQMAGGSQLYNGTIDELSIWNRSLSASEVSDLWNGGDGLLFGETAGLNVNLISPEDNYVSPLVEVEFNCSVKIIGGGSTIVNLSLLHNGTGTWEINQTVDLTGTENSTLFNTSISEDATLWSCEACDSDDDCSLALENRTVSSDQILPIINIISPTAIMGFGAEGINESVNWTIIEPHLDSCWFEYNLTNTTVNCEANNYSFLLEEGVYNLTFYANDSVGNLGFNFTNWSYAIFKVNQSFNNVTFSSAEETFTFDFLLDPSVSITSAVMDYNGTNYTSNILSIGEARRLSNTINVPGVSEATNFTFKFFINTPSQLFGTSSSTQLVASVNMTNCSGGGTVILNMSLFDERLKTNITGDIEVNAKTLDKSSLNNAGSTNLSFNGTHNAAICVSLSEALPSLYLDAEIRYFSEGYATELYHIQRADLTNAPINLSLFDLLTNESTEFLVTYQDDDLILVADAIIQLQRKYISEGIYEVVEAPLTSDSGTVVVHVDLNTNKYRATIVKNGEVLDFFDNIVFNCESELSGQCTHDLLGKIDPQNDVSIEDLTDFSYTISRVNDTITTAFSIPSGTPQSVNVFLNQIDQFNNSYPCNNTVFSSAGSIDCVITPTIGDSFLELTITKAEELQAQKAYVIQEDLGLDFAGNNYFILLILMLSVVGMAFTSPEWIVINGVLTMVLAGALYLANGLNFVVGLGNLIWLVIAAVILIFKLSHQEDR